jgi:hypothetical protein
MNVLTIAIALVRAWTRLYTCRMDPALRDARRAEIESDLYESQEDVRWSVGEPRRVAAQMLTRLLLGVRHDLLWRAEHPRLPVHLLRRALWATAAVSLFAVWWMVSALQTKEPPLPPSSQPAFIDLRLLPPPPPPPPPRK